MTLINLDQPQNERRFRIVWQNMAGLLGLSNEERDQTKITPLGLTPNKRNEDIQYHIVLPRPVSSSVTEITPAQPGCKSIPPDTTEFILRLNDRRGTGLGPKTLIEHEVGMLTLLSDALSQVQPAVVPRVFAWRSAADGPGWYLREYMQGEQLTKCLSDDDDFAKNHTAKVREQIATIIKGLQDYHLPPGIFGLGSVTFDDRGRIISAPRPYDGIKPWANIESLLSHLMADFLRETLSNPDYDGWRESGVRIRIRKFFREGLPSRFAALASKHKKSIVHANLFTDHILCDPATGRITGLIGNGGSHISHPLIEFLESSATFHYLEPGSAPNESLFKYTKGKILYRYHSPTFNGLYVPDSERTIERWVEDLDKQGAQHPGTIEGADQIAEIYTVIKELKVQESGDVYAITCDESEVRKKLDLLGF